MTLLSLLGLKFLIDSGSNFTNYGWVMIVAMISDYNILKLIMRWKE